VSIAASPIVGATIAKDVGRAAVGGFLRRIPLVGNAVADNVVGEDPRYTYHLTPAQLEKAWEQTRTYFRECPTCAQIVCLSCFDQQSGFCNNDSPRREEIAEASAEQAVGVIKGIASAFGLDQVAKQAAEAAQRAPRCGQCGTMVAAGTKFCPECGTRIAQATTCANCGTELQGAKFCPECGTKAE
jgi:RNA polymerase subunit RPABC4/transcription elongation factor Spt4